MQWAEGSLGWVAPGDSVDSPVMLLDLGGAQRHLKIQSWAMQTPLPSEIWLSAMDRLSTLA